MAKALIVSSDDDSRYLYEVAIKYQKIEVKVASTIKEAVRKILTGLPDLVILDMETIDFDELSALKEVKQKLKKLPIIVMTDLAEAEAKRKACVAGVCKILTKKQATVGNLIKTVRKSII